MNYMVSKFTWFSNKKGRRTWKRLDRAVINSRWTSNFPDSRLLILEGACSDHSPLLIQYVDTCVPSSFKFQRMWEYNHPKFIDCVNQSWNQNCSLIGLDRLAFKIKRLKIALKSWTFQVFGNIFQNLARMRDKIQETDMELEGDCSNTLQAQ